MNLWFLHGRSRAKTTPRKPANFRPNQTQSGVDHGRNSATAFLVPVHVPSHIGGVVQRKLVDFKLNYTVTISLTCVSPSFSNLISLRNPIFLSIRYIFKRPFTSDAVCCVPRLESSCPDVAHPLAGQHRRPLSTSQRLAIPRRLSPRPPRIRDTSLIRLRRRIPQPDLTPYTLRGALVASGVA